MHTAYCPPTTRVRTEAVDDRLLQETASRAIEFHIEGMLENGDPVPEAPMTFTQALDHHIRTLEEHGEPAHNSPTTVSTVAVDVEMPRTIQTT